MDEPVKLWCSHCLKHLDPSCFWTSKKGKILKPCKKCKAAACKRNDAKVRANPELARAATNRRRDSLLKLSYGLSLKAYEEMAEAQNGKCAICLTKVEGNFDVDHCHETGFVRGLLCRHCNLGLGHFKDCPVLVNAALKYLWSRRKSLETDDAEFPI